MNKAFNLITTWVVLLIAVIYVYGIAKYWIDFGHPPLYLQQPHDPPNPFFDAFILLLCYFISHVIQFSKVLEELLALWADRQAKRHRTVNQTHGILGAAFVYRCLGIWVAFSGCFIIILTLLLGWSFGFKLDLPLMPLVYFGFLAGLGSSLILKIFEEAFEIDTLEPPDNVQIGILIIAYSLYPTLATVFLLVINRLVSASY